MFYFYLKKYKFEKRISPSFFPLPLSHHHASSLSLKPYLSSFHRPTTMQDIFGSVRRSLVLRSPDGDDTSPGTLVDKINSCIRKSRVFSRASPPPLIPKDATAPSIRCRKGELIGCGAFGRVYMGMNLDSGELIAVKQVGFCAFSILLPSILESEFHCVSFPSKL